MKGIFEIQVTTRKNGRRQAWFRDDRGRRIGTRVGIDRDQGSWLKAQQFAFLASYYIQLQLEQLDAGIGSDGRAMPKLQGSSRATFKDGKFQSRAYSGYLGQKRKFGGRPVRDLLGPGKNGHMRDDIRMNYVDDTKAKVSITRKSSRDKALANERRAPWWGLTPQSREKFARMMADVLGGSFEEYLAQIGLIETGAYMVKLAKMLNARKAMMIRDLGSQLGSALERR